MANTMKKIIHKVVIVGSGPAGHTAALYSARACLDPILYEGFMAGGIAAGGQLTTTSHVENFPGFPESIEGMTLMDNMRAQSIKHGAKIVTETIDKVDFKSRPFKLYPEGNSTDPILAHSVIIATGATAKKNSFPGVNEYWNRGISACAVCDGGLPIFRDKKIAVLGGGDSACEEASYLTKFASHVYLLMRRDKFRASATMEKRVIENPKITVMYGMVPKAAHGDGKLLTHLDVEPTEFAPSGSVAKKLDVSGFFFAIGHTPNVTAFENSGLTIAEDKYLVTEPGTTKTNIEGVFACGDVTDRKYRQAITAAGMGCMAALDCLHWLEENMEGH